jgi:vacuolar-type H+-ATPase subunit F/Vma7
MCSEVIKMICISEKEYRILLIKERAYEWLKRNIQRNIRNKHKEIAKTT